ncbi:eukaryotic translation initiation factor 3 subunit 7 (eIF-3), partial [Helicosporidium sp. ATCC 50920]
DRRPGSSLERLSNAETAPDAIAEDEAALNGVQQLSAESTAVHAALAAQVLLSGGGQSAKARDAASRRLGDALPEALQRGGGQVDGGYVYRRWTVSPALTLTVRCNVPGLVEVGDSLQRVAVHALNEFDPKWSGVDWRAKLDSQRGAVLATELKNNAAKMARWTVAALLGGVDLIKLGYLSRVLVKDASNHVLLGTQTVKPRDFAAQMNLSLDNAWGVARTLLELVAAKGRRDGVYLLVKDPNKPQLRLYALPTGGLDARAAAADDAEEDITLAPGQDD